MADKHVGRVVAQAVLDASQYNNSLRQMQSQTSAAVSGLKSTFASLGVGLGLGIIAREIYQITTQVDRARLAMTRFVGSSAGARALESDIRKLSTTIGIDFVKGLEQANRLLVGGLGADQAARALKDFTDAAAGDPAKIERLSNALSQMFSKGKVSAEELVQQMGEIIPAARYVAEGMGISTREMNLQMNKPGGLNITPQQASQYIFKGIERDFGGLSEQFAKTFGGQIQILVQQLKQFGQTIGEAILPPLTNLIKALNSLFGWMSRINPEFTAAVVQGVALAAIWKVLLERWEAFSGLGIASMVHERRYMGAVGDAIRGGYGSRPPTGRSQLFTETRKGQFISEAYDILRERHIDTTTGRTPRPFDSFELAVLTKARGVTPRSVLGKEILDVVGGEQLAATRAKMLNNSLKALGIQFAELAVTLAPVAVAIAAIWVASKMAKDASQYMGGSQAENATEYYSKISAHHESKVTERQALVSTLEEYTKLNEVSEEAQTNVNKAMDTANTILGEQKVAYDGTSESISEVIKRLNELGDLEKSGKIIETKTRLRALQTELGNWIRTQSSFGLKTKAAWEDAFGGITPKTEKSITDHIRKTLKLLESGQGPKAMQDRLREIKQLKELLKALNETSKETEEKPFTDFALIDVDDYKVLSAEIVSLTGQIDDLHRKMAELIPTDPSYTEYDEKIKILSSRLSALKTIASPVEQQMARVNDAMRQAAAAYLAFNNVSQVNAATLRTAVLQRTLSPSYEEEQRALLNERRTKRQNMEAQYEATIAIARSNKLAAIAKDTTITEAQRTEQMAKTNDFYDKAISKSQKSLAIELEGIQQEDIRFQHRQTNLQREIDLLDRINQIRMTGYTEAYQQGTTLLGAYMNTARGFKDISVSPFDKLLTGNEFAQVRRESTLRSDRALAWAAYEEQQQKSIAQMITEKQPAAKIAEKQRALDSERSLYSIETDRLVVGDKTLNNLKDQNVELRNAEVLRRDGLELSRTQADVDSNSARRSEDLQRKISRYNPLAALLGGPWQEITRSQNEWLDLNINASRRISDIWTQYQRDASDAITEGKTSSFLQTLWTKAQDAIGKVRYELSDRGIDIRMNITKASLEAAVQNIRRYVERSGLFDPSYQRGFGAAIDTMGSIQVPAFGGGPMFGIPQGKQQATIVIQLQPGLEGRLTENTLTQLNTVFRGAQIGLPYSPSY